MNAVEGQGHHQSSSGGCTGRGGSAPWDPSFPRFLPEYTGLDVRSGVCRLAYFVSPAWHTLGAPRSAERIKPQLRARSAASACPPSGSASRGPGSRCSAIRKRAPAPPASAVPPARRAALAARRLRAIDPAAGTRAHRPPSPRFSLLIEVCLSRVRSGRGRNQIFSCCKLAPPDQLPGPCQGLRRPPRPAESQCRAAPRPRRLPPFRGTFLISSSHTSPMAARGTDFQWEKFPGRVFVADSRRAPRCLAPALTQPV